MSNATNLDMLKQMRLKPKQLIAQCADCKYVWIAYRVVDSNVWQCPNCREMSGVKVDV